jgi:hypothetical protein
LSRAAGATRCLAPPLASFRGWSRGPAAARLRLPGCPGGARKDWGKEDKRSPKRVARARRGDAPSPGTDPGTRRPFCVFAKQDQAGTHVYRGTVDAHTPLHASSLARSTLDDPERPGIVWWVCPQDPILRTDPEQAESMFGPARAKRFRQPAGYRTESLMRAIKERGRRGKGEPG